MYLDLKRRIPEPEAMEGGTEAKNYLKAHQRRHEKNDSYFLVGKHIHEVTKVKRGCVLDVGCGYGGLIAQLHHINQNLFFVGIDVSRAMLSLAKNYTKGIPTKLYRTSAEKTNFHPETFDLVVCKDTFHHFAHPIKVLQEMYRLTKEGGTIYITDLIRDVDQDLIFQIVQSLVQVNERNAQQYFDSVQAAYTLQEMRKLLAKAGIQEYMFFARKFDRNCICRYRLDEHNTLPGENYIAGHWVLVIRK